MRAADTETTGLTLHHGARPFYFSGCDDKGCSYAKQWEVNPWTRTPQVPRGDIEEITDYLHEDQDGVCFQNIKFDLHGLRYIGVRLPPWKKLHCTLTMMHALDSAEPHDLKGMAAKYFNYPLEDESDLLKIVVKARRIAKKLGWAIASPLHPHFRPHSGDVKKCGPEADYWLPRAVALYDEAQSLKLGNKWKPLLTRTERELWKVVCSRYGNSDAERTILIGMMAIEELKKQGLWKAYLLNRQALCVAFSEEKRGVHVHTKILASEIKRIQTRADFEFSRAKQIGIEATGNELFNPGSGPQLQKLLHEIWDLPIHKTTDTGQASTEFEVLMKLAFSDEKMPPQSRTFLKSLMTAKKFEKAAQSERKFQDCLVGDRIHANHKVTGTRTTRKSIDDPGLQTAAKDREQSENENLKIQEFLDDLYHGELNPRIIFGPPKGFYWFSVDYNQLQLRIFAAVSKEQKLIDAFEAGWKAHDFMASEIFTRRKELQPGIAPNKQQKRVGKCFHPDTQVLTKTGWKRISDLSNGEEVIQAIPLTNGKTNLSWTVPTSIFSMENDRGFLLHLKNEGIDLRVTDNHRMLGWKQNGKPDVVMPHRLNLSRQWANSGVLFDDTECGVSPELLRLAVAVQADGSYASGMIRFGFTKTRKTVRLKKLLKDANVAYRNRISSQGATEFIISTEEAIPVRKLLTSDKQLPYRWLQLPLTLRNVVLDEARYWDTSAGTKRTGYSFLSTIERNLDVLQAIASISGRKSRIAGNDKCRRLSVSNKHGSRGGNLSPKKKKYKGDVWCLTVPSSFVLVRDGGVPIITGQSVNFGYIFGAGRDKIEESSGILGLLDVVNKMFPNAHKYMSKTKREVYKEGFVMAGEYKLMCEMGHKGVNYKVQGLEGQIVKRALINCHKYLLSQEPEGFITLDIHDEIVFEMPLPDGVEDIEDLKIDDCPHLRELCTIMVNAGAYYGVKTPVAAEVIFTSWNRGRSVV